MLSAAGCCEASYVRRVSLHVTLCCPSRNSLILQPLVTPDSTLFQVWQSPLGPQIQRPILYPCLLMLFKSTRQIFLLNVSGPLASPQLLNGCQFLFRIPSGSPSLLCALTACRAGFLTSALPTFELGHSPSWGAVLCTMGVWQRSWAPPVRCQ